MKTTTFKILTSGLCAAACLTLACAAQAQTSPPSASFQGKLTLLNILITRYQGPPHTPFDTIGLTDTVDGSSNNATPLDVLGVGYMTLFSGPLYSDWSRYTLIVGADLGGGGTAPDLRARGFNVASELTGFRNQRVFGNSGSVYAAN